MVKKPVFDKEAILFRGALQTIALEHYNATTIKPEADSFSEKIYQDYIAAGKPLPLEAWLIERLKNSFKYMDKPPVWVYGEPIWPYHNSEPMVFISQTSVIENAITVDHLTPDRALHLFGTRVATENGRYTMFYKVVEESPSV